MWTPKQTKHSWVVVVFFFEKRHICYLFHQPPFFQCATNDVKVNKTWNHWQLSVTFSAFVGLPISKENRLIIDCDLICLPMHIMFRPSRAQKFICLLSCVQSLLLIFVLPPFTPGWGGTVIWSCTFNKSLFKIKNVLSASWTILHDL